MMIVEDKGQQAGKHEIKHQWWNCHDVELLQLPLPAGDYILWTDEIAELVHRKSARNIAVKKMDFLGSYDMAVDTKKDMQEIVGNICGVQHARFRDECILAQKNGIKLYVLIENRDHIQSIDDVEHWQNPRIVRYNRIKDAHSVACGCIQHCRKRSRLPAARWQKQCEPCRKNTEWNFCSAHRKKPVSGS